MKIRILRSATVALIYVPLLAAQQVTPTTGDDTKLTQVIVFGRHSVRAAVAPDSMLNSYAVQPYPAFAVPTGNLTENGRTLETQLGAYYRLWLTKEGLLTGDDAADSNTVYFRANVIERTIETAKAFWTGLLPAAGPPNVEVVSGTSDPLFDPVGAGVARLDLRLANASVMGRLGGNPQSLAAAYASEFALTRALLLGYPIGQIPPPPAPAGMTDITALPIEVTPGWPVNFGGLSTLANAVDPFLMQYADNMPASQIGWGKLTPAGISQTSRLYNLAIDLSFRTPYLASVMGSNIASHIVRSMLQSATGHPVTGALGNPSTKAIVLIGSDVNISGLAGLFHIDWILPGYQENLCPPGGALVFELRQSESTGAYIVRAKYIAQTMDQLRNRSPLTLAAPPATAPLFIHGCSVRNATFDCALADFVALAKRVVDPDAADRTN